MKTFKVHKPQRMFLGHVQQEIEPALVNAERFETNKGELQFFDATGHKSVCFAMGQWVSVEIVER